MVSSPDGKAELKLDIAECLLCQESFQKSRDIAAEAYDLADSTKNVELRMRACIVMAKSFGRLPYLYLFQRILSVC